MNSAFLSLCSVFFLFFYFMFLFEGFEKKYVKKGNWLVLRNFLFANVVRLDRCICVVHNRIKTIYVEFIIFKKLKTWIVVWIVSILN